MGGIRRMGKKFDPEETVDLIWCRDSETGERVLVDREKGIEVGRWKKKKDCPYCQHKENNCA